MGSEAPYFGGGPYGIRLLIVSFIFQWFSTTPKFNMFQFPIILNIPPLIFICIYLYSSKILKKSSKNSHIYQINDLDLMEPFWLNEILARFVEKGRNK